MLDALREFIDTYLQGRLTSLIDIAVVAFLIYGLFILIRGTRALQGVIGLSVLYAVYLIAQFFELRLLSTLLQAGAVVGLFAIVVVFQPELRRALEQLGRVGSVNRLFTHREASAVDRMAREVSRAGRLLAEERHGALIVLERETGLHDLTAESGITLDAELSAELLLSIFFPRSPLHDGAVVISGTRVVAAGVLLPLSNNVLDSGRYGTRHRAAIGVSEQTDAIVVVVSEESGSISLVRQGRIERNLTEEKLRRRLLNLFRPPTARTAVPLLRRTLEGRWLTHEDRLADGGDEGRVVEDHGPVRESAHLAQVAGERRR
ncbi:MAG: diadenylate cyclase CdaA [Chloroflexota bacterium]|nr:diadenylate cyclase CdaA [Chloroflexota bacterium]